MKHLTYKISPYTLGWLYGTKKKKISVPKQYMNGLPATHGSSVEPFDLA